MNPIQPAIVRQNVRSIQSLMDCCANGYRATVAQAETWLLNHEELHKRYKEKFTTWDEACLQIYGVHRQAVHKRVTQICDRILSPVGDNLLDKANATVSLKHMEKADLSCVPIEIRESVVEHIHDAHKPHVPHETIIEPDEPEKPHIQTADEERAPMPKPSLALSGWAFKLVELFDKCPRTEFVVKTDLETRKVIDNGIASLRAALSPFLPKPPELCKCGCGLPAQVSETLFRAGVPCAGLTRGQAGMLISKIQSNNWKLPEAFAFTRNDGEWIERQFKGKSKKEA